MNDTATPIRLGSAVPSALDEALTFWTEDAELKPHLDRPWLRAYAAAQLGGRAPQSRLDAHQGGVVADAAALERHTILFGATGSGKSRLAFHLIAEQMRRGCSVVALDPKATTIARLIDCARAAGLPPERVTVLDPARTEAGVPGWNPLLTGLPVLQAAAGLVSLLERIASSWGPRLGDILTQALVLLAAHRLSLYELPPLLTQPDYREGLLRLPFPLRRPAPGAAAFAQAHAFFSREFSAWSRSDQAGAVSPVLNKVRGLLGSDFFEALLCARRNTFDLATLWQEPGAVLVHLDPGALGDEGARLLGGAVAYQLFRTAMRDSGPVPVVLSMDELGAQERFIGESLIDIVTVAREQNLRLLAASQHMGRLSAELRSALLANAAVQGFFQLGHEDARPVAATLAAGADETLRRATAVVAGRDRVTGRPERTSWRHPVLGPDGTGLRLDAELFSDLLEQDLLAPPGSGWALRRVQELAGESGMTRLYVPAADTGQPVALDKYVAGLAESDYRFDGPAPLELVVTFPKAKFVHSERRSGGDLTGQWVRTLHELPPRHAVVWLRGRAPAVVKVVEVPDLPRRDAECERYSEAAYRESAQPWEELVEVFAWRERQLAGLANDQEPDEPPGVAGIPKKGESPKDGLPSACVEKPGSKGKATGAGKTEPLSVARLARAEAAYAEEVAADGSLN